MSKNAVRILSIALLTAVLLAACAPEAPAPAPVEVVRNHPDCRSAALGIAADGDG